MRCTSCLVVVALCLASSAHAAIAEVQFPTAGTATTTTTCSTGSATWTTGNLIVATVAINSTTNLSPTVSQSSGSNTYTLQKWASTAGTNANGVYMYTAPNITGGTFQVTFTWTGNQNAVCNATEYSGVATWTNGNGTTNAAIGGATNSQQAVANPTINYITDDANDWCVMGVAGNGNTATSATTGNLRGHSQTTGVDGSMGDNTVAGAGGLCTVKFTNTATNYGIGVIELRSTYPTGITFNQGATSCAECDAVSTCSANIITIFPGDLLVVNVGSSGTAEPTSVSGAASPAGFGASDAFTNVAGASQNTTFLQAIWDLASNNAGSNSYVVTATFAASANLVVCAITYEGATSFGNSAVSSTTSVSLTTQDLNNYCVGGFDLNSATAITPIVTGTARNNNTPTSVGGAMGDNTLASPGTCTVAYTHGKGGLIELRTLILPKYRTMMGVGQ